MNIDGDARPLIVHVVYRFDVGGLENGVVNLINELPAERWRHTVMALDHVEPRFFARIKRRDVGSLSLRKGPGHAVRLYPKLTRLFKSMRPSIVHTRNLAALEVSVPAWLAGVPARIHGEHGRDAHDVDGSSKKYQWIRRAFSPFVGRYVTVSEDLHRYLEQRIGINPERISHIYNGVDARRFLPALNRKSISGSPFADPDLWIVGAVGRLELVKDQVALVRAFAIAIAEDIEARARLRLILVGDGPLRESVEKAVAELGVADLVWLAGERHDVPEILQGLDCFILPSRSEGISNTILEAMSSGLPVIATRVGGNAELVDDKRTGALVPREDARALAERIVYYMKNPAMAREHGRNGRRRVEQSFSMRSMSEQYDRLYTSMLTAAGVVPTAPHI